MAQPGSWLGDAVEEFKGLPTWGKILAVVVVIAVAIFAFIQWKNKQSGSSTSTTGSSTSGSSDTTTSSGTPYYPNVSSNGTTVPALPSNVNPVYSPSGTLEGYQQQPVVAPTSNPTSQSQPTQQQTTTTTTTPTQTSSGSTTTTTPTGIGNDKARDAAILAAERTYWKPEQKSQLDAAIAAAKAQYPRSGPTIEGDGGISFGAMLTHRPEIEPHNSGTPFFPVYPRLERND